MAYLLDALENTVFVLIAMRIVICLGLILIVVKVGYWLLRSVRLSSFVKHFVAIRKRKITRYMDVTKLIRR